MSHWCNKCHRIPYTGCDSKCPVFGLEYEDVAKKFFERDAEVERLNKEVDRLSQVVLYHDGQISDAQKDMIDEFEEALKDAFNFGYTILEKSICDVVHQVAIKLKEGDNDVSA